MCYYDPSLIQSSDGIEDTFQQEQDESLPARKPLTHVACRGLTKLSFVTGCLSEPEMEFMLSNLPHLVSLDLCRPGFRISQELLQFIGKNNAQLRDLNLSHSVFDEKIDWHAVMPLFTNLRQLWLQSCRLPDGQVQALHCYYGHLSKLKMDHNVATNLRHSAENSDDEEDPDLASI